jgi:hypothetical protein
MACIRSVEGDALPEKELSRKRGDFLRLGERLQLVKQTQSAELPQAPPRAKPGPMSCLVQLQPVVVIARDHQPPTTNL